MVAPVSDGPNKWEDLCGDLMRTTLVERQDIFGIFRLSATCKSWEEAIDLDTTLPFGKPCLLMTSEEVEEVDGHEYVVDRRDEDWWTYQLKDLMPENNGPPASFRALVDVRHQWWVGAKGAWLAIVDDHRKAHLLNPYTRHEIPLPPITVPDNAFPSRAFERIVVCQTPSDASGYLVIGMSSRSLAITRDGDESWTALRNPDGYFRDYEDAILHKGKVFAVTEYGRIYVWDDIQSGGACHELPSLPHIDKGELDHITGSSWKLAETADGRRLRVVCTYGKYETIGKSSYRYGYQDYASFVPEGVVVYERDVDATAGSEGDKGWSRVASLGDHSLFLGWNYPFFARVVGSSEGQRIIWPNSICFAKGQPSVINDFVDDVQVFSLGTGNYMYKEAPLYNSPRFSVDYQIPIWFIPMLRSRRI